MRSAGGGVWWAAACGSCTRGRGQTKPTDVGSHSLELFVKPLQGINTAGGERPPGEHQPVKGRRRKGTPEEDREEVPKYQHPKKAVHQRAGSPEMLLSPSGDRASYSPGN